MSPRESPDVFSGFFDDAAVYPPGNAPLTQAVENHLARRRTTVARIMGPLVLPFSMLAEANHEVAAAGAEPVDVHVVTTDQEAPTVLSDMARYRCLTLAGLEIKLVDNASDVGFLHELGRRTEALMYVELDAERVRAGVVDDLVPFTARAKFRTGGVRADLFPTSGELAEMIDGAVQAGVPFKLTAGLHEAIRFTSSATGFTHHGFINIAVAVAQLRAGATAGDAVATLDSTRADALVDSFATLPPDWRQTFVSFGTCSVPEPALSLERLGLMEPGMAALADKAETA